MDFREMVKGEPDWDETLNGLFARALDEAAMEAHNQDPNAHGGLSFDGQYAPIVHQHEMQDVRGLEEALAQLDEKLIQLQDLMSNDMPGALIFEADFSGMSNITIRDGVWNSARRTIDA